MARRLGMARRQGQALLGVPNADHQRRHDRAATLVGPASGGPPAGPRDALVAGFDDIPAASWAAYDLATFVQDGARMVDEAMAILTSRRSRTSRWAMYGSSCRPGSWSAARRGGSPYVTLKPPSTRSDTPVIIAARSERR
jgi:hypothetical protein